MENLKFQEIWISLKKKREKSKILKARKLKIEKKSISSDSFFFNFLLSTQHFHRFFSEIFKINLPLKRNKIQKWNDLKPYEEMHIVIL